ncbi:TPA_exp: Uncharacterized protein A8136_2924 [Trichophyton benhamiae CBS 112371]|uniref:Uncharacterized protein n=1 Tax=Arthroderma benhamiae (strain ATCC MYA-4681 / CBS 112371) TaxID=663331 RepID=D4ALT4_ARTBC|nr:uncharacterized protein ARB_05282 [Trichophyton benhamiae CBS 112371]EFE36343.1 hypothetical protein ARB_05282 [Trichophyton benhamiae CBS 112371]DAA79139.1 TPA_exp: Uncharacterized protein A8136_2924 [Trichophyton benhamiae CBS 112371]
MTNSPFFRLNLLPLSLFSLLVSGLTGAVPAPHPDSTDYEGVVPGSLGDAGSDGSTGSSGAEGGSIKIPKGGLIAIIIVVVIVVIIGITTGILFYQAKRRQWTMRETMRYSVRKVAESIKSPLTPTFRSRGQYPMTPAGAKAVASRQPKSSLQPKNPMSHYQNRLAKPTDQYPRVAEGEKGRSGKPDFNFSKLLSSKDSR